MTCYPEMNAQIVALLKGHDNPTCAYAAERIVELEAQLQQAQKQLPYAIALQRAIEHHCAGEEVPEWVAVDCPHHAKMLNERVGQLQQVREERDGFKQVAEHKQQGYLSAVSLYEDKVSTLQTTILSLREALGLKILGKHLDQYLQEQFPATIGHRLLAEFCFQQHQALSSTPQQFRKEWCKRSVLEKFIEPVEEVVRIHADPDSPDYNECDKPGEQCHWCDLAKEALTLARAELSEEKP